MMAPWSQKAVVGRWRTRFSYRQHAAASLPIQPARRRRETPLAVTVGPDKILERSRRSMECGAASIEFGSDHPRGFGLAFGSAKRHHGQWANRFDRHSSD
jgi:hypothetical protein